MKKIGLLLFVSVLLSACVTVDSNPNANKANPKEAAKLNTRLGIDYLRLGNHDRALSKLQKALKEDPDLASAHAAIAFLYSREGKNDEARKHYERATDLAPDDPDISNQYGAFLCEHGHYDKAQHLFKAATDNHHYSRPEVALTNAGVCARKNNHLKTAGQFFRRALRINPKYPDALRQMADLSYRDGHYMQAKAFLERYDSYAKSTAETLWLEVLTERKLGNASAAGRYAAQLRSLFPASRQTEKLQQLRND